MDQLAKEAPWSCAFHVGKFAWNCWEAFVQVAKRNFRDGGANLPVCRDDPQVVAHHFGNLFWQLL